MSVVGMSLSHYVRVGWTYRWLVVVPAVLGFLVMTLIMVRKQDQYETSAVLMSPVAKPNDSLLRRAVITRAKDIMRTAHMMMLDQDVLRELAIEINPYPELRARKGIEAVIPELRKNIRITQDRRTNTLRVGFTHEGGDEAPALVARVVAKLTTIFIEHQKQFMRDESVGIGAFFRNMEADHAEKLELAEIALQKFRRAHPDELPENVDTNRGLISHLEILIEGCAERRQRNILERRRVEDDYVRIEYVMDRRGQDERVDSTLTIIRRSIEALHTQRTNALATHEETSPHIRKIDTEIALWKERLKEEESKEDKVKSADTEYNQWLLDRLKERDALLDEDIDLCDQQADDFRAKIKLLEQRIENARGLQAKFDTLMRRVDDATLRRAQVQRTRLEIDDAVEYQKYDMQIPVEVTQEAAEPDGPTGPARLRLSFLGLLGGLGMGVALALLRKRLDRSYQRSDDLRLLLPGTVLITVPEVTPTGRRVVRGLTGISAALLLAAVFTGSLFILGVREQLWGSPEIVRDLLSFLTLS